MLTKIDHIGIAVPSINEALAYYEGVLGLNCQKIEDIPSQKLKTAFLEIGDVHIELLEATSEESTIAKFIKKNGPGIHHIAFATDNLNEQLAIARNNGCKLVNEVPFEGANDKLVAFLHPKSTFGVLTELCSHK